ncbi:malate dehydrogenase [Basidiobolus meristosporus CBS 931.73]|uniref:Malate dehydrogenase n=1 Tax=Basidiobolus meristosporus CBS 931.73 TaxID=1314790 RepID=A0A1Y1VXU8_9FUNG|nr:malate dehydrogenase [Basidiobolus meristosporus CBS 931.73]|eukprot:ORX66099.1 malate dehydrogenase [Basidiobolus meristosporus CBS 931.73]
MLRKSSQVTLHDASKRPGNRKSISTRLTGELLLNNSLLNKGSAFTQEERETFGLNGLLPYSINTLEEQCQRAYKQYACCPYPLAKNEFLQSLHEQNEVLFYGLLERHLREMLPIIYTPTEGEYIEKYSYEFRKPRGVYLTYPAADDIAGLLFNGTVRNNARPDDIDLIVVTDSEEILGIGDQGVGGIGISVAKLVLYTLLGGIHPGRVIPVVLDVGTNNQKLLDDPLYMGWREKRLPTKEYDNFVEKFVKAVQIKFPNAYLHWEDFGLSNARRILNRYQDRLCTFNDDIQGTGAITLVCILAALKVIIFGAGTAGIGIADQITAALVREARMSVEEAAKKIWLVDRVGLIHQKIPPEKLSFGQCNYSRPFEEVSSWKSTSTEEYPTYSLFEVVQNIHPTILIGTSTAPNTWTQQIIEAMASECEFPMIFPLSNPTAPRRSKPCDITKWTKGKALIATGSPFPATKWKEQSFEIAECNNSFIYPGIGLGCVVCKPSRLTDDLIWAAVQSLSEHSPAVRKQDRTLSLLPSVEESKKASVIVACAVIKEALKRGLAKVDIAPDEIEGRVVDAMWRPEYVPLEKA